MKKITTLILLLLISFSSIFAKEYKRIISLAPSVTQSLYFLNAQDRLVGCTSYCLAAKKDNKDIVSSAVKPNIEKIISLKPDLVIGSGLTNPRDVATLEKVGIKVKIYTSPKNFAQICSQFLEIGTMVGKRKEAIKIVRESIEKVREISQQMKWQTTPDIFFQIGVDPIFTVVDNAFMNDYIRLLKGRNIAAGLTKGTLSREFVLAKNPQFIFISTMGMIAEEETKNWKKYNQLDAAKNNQIFIVNSDIACQPTPVTFAETLETLGKYILNKKQ